MVIHEEMSQEATNSMECETTISEEFLGILNTIQSPPLDKFSSLNDDCVRSILQYLDIFELIAVRQLSSRFVAIADKEISTRKQEDFMPFLLKQKIVYFDLIKNRRPTRRITLYEAEKILKCVGNFVTKIHLNSCSFQAVTRREIIKKTIRLELLLRLIENYCDSGNLSGLVIWNFHMVENMRHFSSIWRNLRTLEIVNFDTRESELETILLDCENLGRLEIGVVEEDVWVDLDEDETMKNNITGSCLSSQPRTIRSLKLTNCKNLNLNALCRYFEQNPQLERFFYTKHPDNGIGIILYGQISRRLKNLRQLSLDGIGRLNNTHFHSSIINMQNINSLSNLKRLKKLKFDACGQDISLLLVRLANNEGLDELSLRNAVIDERMYIKSVPFTGLKIFKIYFKGLNEIFSSYLENISRIVHFLDLEDLHLEYMNIDQLGTRIDMEKIERGLLMLMERAPSVGRLFIRIPSLRINISNYKSLVSLCSQRPLQKKLCIYLSRRNMSSSLCQYIRDKQNKESHLLVEIKAVFCDFSYLF